MEDEAWRRAYEGTERPVFQGGELAGHVRDYSDTLTIFLLKGRRPHKYRERADLNVTGDLRLEVVDYAALPGKVIEHEPQPALEHDDSGA